jgi:hypothetical protein
MNTNRYDKILFEVQDAALNGDVQATLDLLSHDRPSLYDAIAARLTERLDLDIRSISCEAVRSLVSAPDWYKRAAWDTGQIMRHMGFTRRGDVWDMDAGSSQGVKRHGCRFRATELKTMRRADVLRLRDLCVADLKRRDDA